MPGMHDSLEKRIDEIRQRDRRYSARAFFFVLEALDFTIEELSQRRRDRHITGKELLMGIRDLARERFGPLAKDVFQQWGILCTEDFGEIVFKLCGAGLLQRRAQDSKQDFEDGFDFDRTFVKEYAPRNPWRSKV